MRFQKVALLSAVLLGTFLLPPASSGGFGCDPFVGWGAVGAAVPGPYWQPSVLAWRTTTSACPGTTVLAAAAPCPPPPFVGAVPGAFCGPVVPPGGAVACTWFTGFSLTSASLLVAFDYNGDGEITAGPVLAGLVDSPLFDASAGAYPASVSVPNLHPFGWAVPGGRMIAFPLTPNPTLGVSFPDATSVFFVNCV